MKLSKRRLLQLFGATGVSVSSSKLLGQSSSGELDEGNVPSGTPRLVQGPMFGAVYTDGVLIWLRTSAAVNFTLEYGPLRGDRTALRQTPVERTTVDNRYCKVASLRGLQPDTEYRVRVLVEGEADPYLRAAGFQTFRTAPHPEADASVVIALGSCARAAEDSEQAIWRSVADYRPDLFFWLGDNVYGDSPDVESLADEYNRQRDIASYLPIRWRIPQLAIWDDHDYGLNNSDRRSPIKDSALAIFRDYWANPSYGLPDTPGVFFKFSYAGIDFFFLDVRFNRDPNDTVDGPGKTMLGRSQLAWLKRGLLESDAPFKILLSGSGWTMAKGPGGDSWASFTHERNDLFDFVRDQGVGGVVLMSGDTHAAELNAIPWSERGGYDFYDLTTSPLAQDASTSWLARRPERRIRQAYGGGANFGLLTIDNGARPSLTYNVVNYLGDRVWQPFTLFADELQNGRSTWLGKMDQTSRSRFESERAGGPYYAPLDVFDH